MVIQVLVISGWQTKNSFQTSHNHLYTAKQSFLSGSDTPLAPQVQIRTKSSCLSLVCYLSLSFFLSIRPIYNWDVIVIALQIEILLK